MFLGGLEELSVPRFDERHEDIFWYLNDPKSFFIGTISNDFAEGSEF